MLSDLITLTSTIEFEEYGTIDLAEVRAEGDVLTLSFNINTGTDSDTYQFWEVESVGWLEHQISLGQCDGIDLLHDHVRLWPYIYPRASLSFYGEARDHLAVVGALYERHVALVGNLVPFTRFMNRNPVEMVRWHYGLFAEGPMPLIEAYAQVLESFQVSTKITDPKPAHYTNDEFSGLAEVGVLILTQDSYLVAPKFNERRVRDPES